MPTREEKRKIRAGLSYFETALKDGEVTLENCPSFLQQLQLLEQLMQSSQVSLQSEFYASLGKIKAMLSPNFFPSKDPTNSVLTSSTNPALYFGISNRTPLILDVGEKRKHSLLLMRRYYKSRESPESVRLSWEFNPLGKIVSLGYCTDDNCHGDILRIVAPFPDDWERQEFGYFQIHPKVYFVNSGFSGLKPTAQYASLLRFGQSMASELFRNLRENKVKLPEDLKEGSKPLTEIVQDAFAMQILKNSKRNPRIERQGDQIFVKY